MAATKDASAIKTVTANSVVLYPGFIGPQGLQAVGILSTVGEGSPNDWREIAASNRERINSLERETTRLRDRQHELAENVAIIRYLADTVRDLGEDVKELTVQVTTLARRVVEKPSAGGVSAAASWVAVLISLATFVYVVTR
jgi:hypothetical protein